MSIWGVNKYITSLQFYIGHKNGQATIEICQATIEIYFQACLNDEYELFTCVHTSKCVVTFVLRYVAAS